jgi:hypothetical protein
VARGIVFNGCLASSLKSAVASKPRKPVAAMRSPMGKEPEKTAAGLNASKL